MENKKTINDYSKISKIVGSICKENSLTVRKIPVVQKEVMQVIKNSLYCNLDADICISSIIEVLNANISTKIDIDKEYETQIDELANIYNDLIELNSSQYNIVDSFDIYRKDIARETELLSADDEKKLILRIKDGDISARNELIKAHLKLVIKIAKIMPDLGIEIKELISIGNTALIEAASRFDLKYGCRFSTYAFQIIKYKMCNARNKNIKNDCVPSKLKPLKINSYIAKRELIKLLGREPEANEVAEYMGISIDEMMKIDNFDYLDALNPQQHEKFYSSSGEIDEIEDEIDRNLLRNLLNEVMDDVKISQTSRDIINKKFGFYDGKEWSESEIARYYNVSRQTINQKVDRVLNKMRFSSKVRKLLEFTNNKEQAAAYIRNSKKLKLSK